MAGDSALILPFQCLSGKATVSGPSPLTWKLPLIRLESGRSRIDPGESCKPLTARSLDKVVNWVQGVCYLAEDKQLQSWSLRPRAGRRVTTQELVSHLKDCLTPVQTVVITAWQSVYNTLTSAKTLTIVAIRNCLNPRRLGRKNSF